MSKKKWLWIVGAALLVPVFAFLGCGPVFPEGVTPRLGNFPSTVDVSLGSQQTGIWVTGQGETTAIPDIATLRLGIEAQEAAVAEAQAQAAEAMDRVMRALEEGGVAEKDIQTQFFNIFKVTRWDEDRRQEIVIGYRVTNIVSAKIRDIDQAAPIIDAVVVAGGDLTRIESISFSIDDPSAYHQEVREKAMADAKSKAEQLASLGGVKLGKPTYISEGLQVPPPIYRQGLFDEALPAAAPPVTPISPGEMEITLTVQVVYAILN